MQFILGLVVGSWIGIIGACCITARNDGMVDRGTWRRLQVCIQERERDALQNARVIATYQAAVMEISR